MLTTLDVFCRLWLAHVVGEKAGERMFRERNAWRLVIAISHHSFFSPVSKISKKYIEFEKGFSQSDDYLGGGLRNN